MEVQEDLRRLPVLENVFQLLDILSINYEYYMTVRVVNSDDGQTGADSPWLKLDVVDLSHNELSYIDSRLFDSPIRTVRQVSVTVSVR